MIIQPLSFVDSLDKQLDNIEGYEKALFTLWMPPNKFLPFQVAIKASTRLPNLSDGLVLVNSFGEEFNIVSYIDANELHYTDLQDYTLVSYLGRIDFGLGSGAPSFSLPLRWANDWCHLEIRPTADVSGVRRFQYSQKFRFHKGQCDLLQITYWHNCGVDVSLFPIVQGSPFVFYFLVDAKFDAPKYLFEQEGTENGLGIFTPDLKKLTKQYRLPIYAPEYFTDVLNYLPLYASSDESSSYVKLVFEEVNRTVQTIEVSSDFGDSENFALTEMLITFKTVFVTNCCH